MNLLFIPHVPTTGIVNRVYEFAKGTGSYLLTWKMDGHSMRAKIRSQLQSLRRQTEGKNVQVPLLFRPQTLAQKHNTYWLNKIVHQLQIDAVVNANALLFDIESVEVPVVYDLVDDHLEVNASIGLTPERVSKIKRDLSHAAGVICVTEQLEAKAKAYNPNTVTIENGLHIDRFSAAQGLKHALGLEGKRVYGYIGGIEAWTGIDRACEAYIKIKNDTNAMIVVGGNAGTFFHQLRKRYGNDILFTGPVSPEKVGNYFKTLDVGLIPFVLNDFTHNALPIKALEYGLAGARVISTPLRGLMEKHLPFIEFFPIERFDQAMETSLAEPFSFDFTEYDWHHQSQKVLQFVRECIDA